MKIYMAYIWTSLAVGSHGGSDDKSGSSSSATSDNSGTSTASSSSSTASDSSDANQIGMQLGVAGVLGAIMAAFFLWSE